MTDPGSIEEGRRIATALNLEPFELEGGLFRRTHTGDGVTAIYFLIAGQDFSAMHRLRTADELYFFHAGSPVEMLLLGEHTGREVILGPDPLAGHSPQLLVPAGTWQGASSSGAWSLLSTVVTTGFDWSDFELGETASLIREHPSAAARIRALTR